MENNYYYFKYWLKCGIIFNAFDDIENFVWSPCCMQTGEELIGEGLMSEIKKKYIYENIRVFLLLPLV